MWTVEICSGVAREREVGYFVREEQSFYLITMVKKEAKLSAREMDIKITLLGCLVLVLHSQLVL